MDDGNPPAGRSGIGIDAAGNPVIDPTENVIALVKAGEKAAEAYRAADNRFLDAQINNLRSYQDFAREAEAKLQNFAREAEAKLSASVSAAETRRVDQLAQTRQDFQNTIRDMLAESVRTTSSLVSTQLVQIQATFDARVTKLEQAQLTQAGRSSVADPATEAALARITNTMSGLADRMSTMQVGESSIGGARRGAMDTNARLLAVVMACAAVASPIIAVVLTMMAMKAH